MEIVNVGHFRFIKEKCNCVGGKIYYISYGNLWQILWSLWQHQKKQTNNTLIINKLKK